jgi:hypothetical protein
VGIPIEVYFARALTSKKGVWPRKSDGADTERLSHLECIEQLPDRVSKSKPIGEMQSLDLWV